VFQSNINKCKIVLSDLDTPQLSLTLSLCLRCDTPRVVYSCAQDSEVYIQLYYLKTQDLRSLFILYGFLFEGIT
jgi:hypothetical protein